MGGVELEVECLEAREGRGEVGGEVGLEVRYGLRGGGKSG